MRRQPRGGAIFDRGRIAATIELGYGFVRRWWLRRRARAIVNSRAGLSGAIGVILLIAWTARARANSVDIPLKLNYLVLDAALRASLFPNRDGRARLWQGESDCQYLDGANPRASRDRDQIKLDVDARLVAGIAVGDRCVGPLDWSGIIESSL